MSVYSVHYRGEAYRLVSLLRGNLQSKSIALVDKEGMFNYCLNFKGYIGEENRVWYLDQLSEDEDEWGVPTWDEARRYLKAIGSGHWNETTLISGKKGLVSSRDMKWLVGLIDSEEEARRACEEYYSLKHRTEELESKLEEKDKEIDLLKAKLKEQEHSPKPEPPTDSTLPEVGRIVWTLPGGSAVTRYVKRRVLFHLDGMVVAASPNMYGRILCAARDKETVRESSGIYIYRPDDCLLSEPKEH